MILETKTPGCTRRATHGGMQACNPCRQRDKEAKRNGIEHEIHIRYNNNERHERRKRGGMR